MDEVAAYTWMLYYAMTSLFMAVITDMVLQRRRGLAITWAGWALVIILPALPVLAAIPTVMTSLNQVLVVWPLQPVLCAIGSLVLYDGSRKFKLQISFYSSIMVMIWCGMFSVCITQLVCPNQNDIVMRNLSINIALIIGAVLLAYVKAGASRRLREYVDLNSGREPPFLTLTFSVVACVTVCYMMLFFEFGDANLLTIVVSVVVTIVLMLLLRTMFITVDEVTNRSRSEAEMRMSQRIQTSVLPEPGKLEWMGGFDVCATMVPAQEVGGDFYDWFRVSDRKVAFVVGDVSDKGVPAALFMMRASGTIREKVSSVPDLGDAISAANSALLEDNPTSMFVTAFVAVLDLDTGELSYVNAGHIPPVSVMGGEVSRLEAKKSPFIGMRPFAYRAERVTLAPGDTVTVFTDGVTEASRKDELFGQERATGIVAGAGTPSGIVKAVNEAVDEYQGTEHRMDDITVLSLSYHPSVHASMPLDDSGIDRAMAMVEEFCEGLPMELSLRAQMCTEELLANVVDHGAEKGGTTMGVTLHGDGEMVMTVEDDCPRFDPTRYKKRSRDAPLEGREKGGEGIGLVRLMSDGMSYRYAGGHNVVTVRFGPRPDDKEE